MRGTRSSTRLSTTSAAGEAATPETPAKAGNNTGPKSRNTKVPDNKSVTKPNTKAKRKSAIKQEQPSDADKEAEEPHAESPKKTRSPPKSASRKRKSLGGVDTTSSKKQKNNAVDMKFNDEDRMPHNLGAQADESTSDKYKAQPTPPSTNKVARAKNGHGKVQIESTLVKKEVEGEEINDVEAVSPEKKAGHTKAKKGAKSSAAEKIKQEVKNEIGEAEPSPKKKAKSAKDNNYGLKSGETPFPDWPHPTPEECKEVNDLLSTVHGNVKPPDTIPTPSLTVTGCGEVPSVLDALIRTRLSAATTGTNSSRAFQGLVKRFGVLKEGVGKGSVDWDSVRRADTKEVFKAIQSGGLADVKSKDIKEILEKVYEDNQARRAALVEAKKTKDASKGPKGAKGESQSEKEAEIEQADSGVLSLDHLHLLSTDDAFQELIKFKGIGPKTASCVLLFCFRRPSFAVDTHVFRLCTWLGWVPPTGAVNRNSTYAHCEVRIPDELKYPLHQLFIKHGKTCPRCRAATGTGSKDWEKGCVIDHLVNRTGKRKTLVEDDSPKKTPKGKKGGRKSTKVDYDEEDSDEDIDDYEEEESEFED